MHYRIFSLVKFKW